MKRCPTWLLTLLAALAAGLPTPSQAVEIGFEPVAEGIYAFIGETGARTAHNEGLNANLGLVVTPAGAAHPLAERGG